MKKYKVLFVLAMFSAFFLMASRANASSFLDPDYSGYWVPTDGDQNVTTIFFNSFFNSTSGLTGFGVYYGDESASLTTISDGLISMSGFTVDRETYVLTTENGDMVQLDNTLQYGFYFEINNVQVKTYSVFSNNVESNQYLLFAGDSNITFIADSAPAPTVPIPPSALLLGSGVVGLIGFGLRRRRYKA